jgi:hypothetical protein
MSRTKYRLNFSSPACCLLIVITVSAVSPEYNSSFGNSDGGETGITATPSASPGAEFSTPNNTNAGNEASDSSAARVEGFYSAWKGAARSCRILLPVAKAKGYMAAADEVAERLSCYARIFPGILIDTTLVKNEIVIEKYLTRDIGLAASDEQSGRMYKNFVDRCRLQRPPSPEDVGRIFACRVLFTMDTVVQLCGELADRQRRKEAELLVTTVKPWDYREIALNADPGQCLVSDPGNRDCPVTVGMFNDYLLISRFERSLPLDVVRETAVRELLADSYFAAKAEQAGLLQDKELVQELEQIVENKLLNLIEPTESEDPVDDELLRRTYDKYHDRFFSEKNIKTVNIIGSTDSLYIDSLLILLKKNESDVDHSHKRTVINSFPWIAVSSAELPDTIVSAVDTLKNQHCRSFKTSFGFFLCRITSVQRRKGIPFEESHEKLMYIIRIEREISQGKPDSIRALEYYRDHVKEFLTPDTLITLAWLVPVIDTRTSGTMDRKMRNQMIAEDTAAFRSMIIRSENLPADIADTLLRYTTDIKNRKQFIGPISSRFGTWHFSVQKSIPGGKQMPFDSVREEIIRTFAIANFPFDSIMRAEDGARILKRTVLAGAYLRALRKQTATTIGELSETEIAKLIENKTVKLPYSKKGPPDRQTQKLARTILLERKLTDSRTEVANWMESLVVDNRILFSGCSGRPEE